jgi:deoxyadenosine/deoxycytidine kinase
VNYNLDGTGRDTYIQSSNGGFFPEKQTNGLRKTFFDKLRNYDRPSTAQYLEKRFKKTVKLTSDGKVVPDQDIFMKT